jgi:hypothetical protein
LAVLVRYRIILPCRTVFDNSATQMLENAKRPPPNRMTAGIPESAENAGESRISNGAAGLFIRRW